jgi:hypothetical protein
VKAKQLAAWACVELAGDDIVVRDEYGASKRVSWKLVEWEVRRGRRVLGPDGVCISLRHAERHMVGLAGGPPPAEAPAPTW